MRVVLSTCAVFCTLAGVCGLQGSCFANAKSAHGAGQAEMPADHGQGTKTDHMAAPSITRHVIQLNGQLLRYTATAGCLPIRDKHGKLQAEMFFIAYAKEDNKDLSRRPIAFAFNGGPGASSIWLHIGGLGPKRTPLAEDGTALPQSFELVDNDSTWLDFTDLVFIDPIGTGYSRVAPGADATPFYTVERDVQTSADFIRLYLTRYDRWLSPKYLVGESYGTTRTAGLAEYLQAKLGINLNGVLLLSSAIDFQTFSFQRGNDLAYAIAVPSYAAAAWYHKRLSPRLQEDLKKTLGEVEHWTIANYLPALASGKDLPDAQRKEIAAKLAEYTGLSENYVERSDLRISNVRFAKELLREQRKKIGILDSRVVGADLAAWNDAEGSDPAMALATGPLVAAINHYLREDLHYTTDEDYVFLSMSVNRSWKWGSAAGGYLNVSAKLKQALTANPPFASFHGRRILRPDDSLFLARIFPRSPGPGEKPVA
jgi:carboxypeptidase C (cathepsin A)